VRKSNQTELVEYLKGNFSGEEEVLDETAAMEEYFFLGLRKMQGVNWVPYQKQYEKIVEKLTAEKLIELDGDYIHLTELGIDVSNYVLAEFLIE
jgi:oxygen-independent coproporphyrinogen-3 oxidase